MLLSKYLLIDAMAVGDNSSSEYIVDTRVSNGTGQCNFSGQRDRSFFLVPGQRDNETS